MQKQYGKTQDELETLVEGFSWALAEYPIEKIKNAMRLYIKSNSDIPAPADIISIIKAEDRKGNIDNIAISNETLITYVKKGIPLSTAQKKRLIGLGLMDEDGELTEQGNQTI